MANAMLEESFKSSHPDLLACMETDDYDSSKRITHSNAKHKANTTNTILLKTTKDMTTSPIRRKSVDFSFESAPKRARRSDPWTPKQVVDAISTCISAHERLEAIQKARDTFDHDLQSIHDDEMASGADAALAKHLTFLVYHYHHHQTEQQSSSSRNTKSPPTPKHRRKKNDATTTTLLKELSLTCSSMERLYRASSDIVGASFHRMGREVLQILVHLIDSEIDRRLETIVVNKKKKTPTPSMANDDDDDDVHGYRNKVSGGGGCRGKEKGNDIAAAVKPAASDGSDDVEGRLCATAAQIMTTETTRVNPDAITPEGDTLLRMATKIVCHFARVGANTRSIAHFPGLLRCFIRLITVEPHDCVPWEARLSALWTIANLACDAENMQMMVCTPGLVAALVQVASRPLHPGDNLELVMELLRSRANASRAILNLSWAPENKVLLAEQANVVDLLAELTVDRTAPLLRSRTVREILVTTRRHAISALRNLAAAPRRIKIGLCEYKNGHLLDVLTDAALNDPDDNVRDLAFAAIHNLAIHDTAVKIVNHPALVLALRGVLQTDSEDENATSPRAHASATLLVLERTITPDMECYESLRDLLDAVNPAIASDESEDSSSEIDVVNATEV